VKRGAFILGGSTLLSTPLPRGTYQLSSLRALTRLSYQASQDYQVSHQKLPLKSNFLSLGEVPSRSILSLLKREERRLKILSEETKHINVSSTSKINTLSEDLLFQREGNI